MSARNISTIQNKILASLPAHEYDRIFPHLTRVNLELAEILYKPEETIRRVYFPNSGVVSLVASMKDGSSVEVGLIGNDGMVGISIVLGDDISPNEAIVQIADGAMRMEVDDLKDELKLGGQLLPQLLRFTVALLKQVSQTAACNRSHNLTERLARWLLMCHDRVEGDELRLTQEFIAQMLGTRRAGVSEAAIVLQSAGLIRYSRGHITVVNRNGLEEFGCECYGIVKAEFDRLFGPSSKRPAAQLSAL
jgi:CRP-like cAMP-binding protein